MNNLKQNELIAINKFKEVISKKYNLVQLKLFGSKAKGNFDKESDIDLFVILDNCNWKIEKEVYELCFEIGLEYNVLLSPIIYSKNEFEDKLTKATPFYKIIEREGIIL